ncbi:MAG TPA: S-layer family protein [Thioploca sp.]|nr:S-layer family protein [Thioploca sp.]
MTDATADTSGPGGGAVFIRAGRFFMDKGWLFADTWGDQPGRGITIHANESVALTNSSLITTQVYADGDFFTEATGAGGHIAFTTGDLSLTGGSQIVGTSESVGAAGNITLSAGSGYEIINGVNTEGFSNVLSDSYGSGNAGEIVISADHLTMDEGAQVRASKQDGTGDAGSISLKVRALDILGGAQVTIGVGSKDNDVLKGTGGKGGILNVEASETMLINGKYSGLFGNVFTLKGQGGTININAPAVTIEKGGRIQAETQYDGNAGHIVLNVDTLTLNEEGVISTNTSTGSGLGGRVEIVANQTVLIKGTSTGITSNAGGSGSGGAIEISAPIVTIDTDGSIQAATGFDGTTYTSGSGTGGYIKIQADQLQLTEKGYIITNSYGEGDAGRIELVLGETLQMQDGSYIEASTTGNGQGGNIEIVANKAVLITGDALIAASTDGAGSGGQINLQAQQLQLENDNILTRNLGSEGNAGSIVLILADTLQVRGNGSQIAASTRGSGKGGNVEIQARHLQMTEGGFISLNSLGQADAGELVLSLGGTLQMEDASIQTEIGTATTRATTGADGGNIKITTPSYLYLINSEISTSVGGGEGQGGNMTIQPQFIVLDGSQILAQAYGGPGGNINITTTGIYNFTGEPIERVINASSKYGVDGEVKVVSPDTDVSSKLLVLPAKYVGAEDQLKSPCHARMAENLSSFVMIASEGAANVPGDLLPSGPRLSKLAPVNMLSSKTAKEIDSRRYSTVALRTGCPPSLSMTH